MTTRGLNHDCNIGFAGGVADLNKTHVFINLRKQNRQKREGFSAS